MEEKILIKEKVNFIFAVVGMLILSGVCFWMTYDCMVGFVLDIGYDWGWLFMLLGGVSAVMAVLICVFGYNSQIVITNRRVFGKTLLGQRVDLPLDSISAVSLTNPLLAGISVSTNSGRITFYLMSQREKAHKVLCDLINDRRKNTSIENHQSNADELKKFKDLLDSGVITQDEFDAKKKQLLGL